MYRRATLSDFLSEDNDNSHVTNTSKTPFAPTPKIRFKSYREQTEFGEKKRIKP